MEADYADAQREGKVDLAPGELVCGRGGKGREVGVRHTPLGRLPSSCVTCVVQE